ncbi:hypothetical protein PsYK624_079820 [Phanerochaete sordida]|uniref:Uncharacterized protein n=1 Tax=Phanerochaete sordida TaxID=48140 RepID=A0A9P3GBQ0_9APHY|nr:hypothetical protein PsYK624_079820 [Phanerochaete sordida]
MRAHDAGRPCSCAFYNIRNSVRYLSSVYPFPGCARSSSSGGVYTNTVSTSCLLDNILDRHICPDPGLASQQMSPRAARPSRRIHDPPEPARYRMVSVASVAIA